MSEEERTKVFQPTVYDTRTGQLDDLLTEKLEHAFDQETQAIMLHDLSKIASEHDPIDLAHAAPRLPLQARSLLFDRLPDLQSKVTFMINAGNNTRSAIFRQLPDEDIIAILDGMPIDEVVWVLDDISDRRYKRILEKLPVEKIQRISQMQKHDRDSAGRLMTDEYFAFHMDTTIGEVAKAIRQQPGVNLTSVIYVLNNYDELIGYVPQRNLIINKKELPIRQVMQPVVHYVTPDSPRDEVVDIMERYELAALPVLDEYHQIVGVIPFEEAVEAMKDIMDNTIASIAGTAEEYDEREPIVRRFFFRAPWLIVTLFAGLTTATSLSLFHGLEWFAIVPLFVPLIAGLSGNVGIQCSTLMIRNISTGELTRGTRREVITKELLIGLLIGLVFGVICGLLLFLVSLLGFDPFDTKNFAVSPPIAIATTVASGIFCACIASSTLGSISPFLFARMGIDPAVAAGPIVTAFNDVMSSWIFIIIAYLVGTQFML